MDPVAIALELLELDALPKGPGHLNRLVATRVWAEDDTRLEWNDQRQRAWQYLLNKLRADAKRRERINGKAA
jgi:hypothetical protein